MKESKPFSLNALDYKKMLKDAIWFSSIPLLFYITAILALLQTQGHVLSLQDFVPSNETLIAIIVYVLNQAVNLLRKYIV